MGGRVRSSSHTYLQPLSVHVVSKSRWLVVVHPGDRPPLDRFVRFLNLVVKLDEESRNPSPFAIEPDGDVTVRPTNENVFRDVISRRKRRDTHSSPPSSRRHPTRGSERLLTRRPTKRTTPIPEGHRAIRDYSGGIASTNSDEASRHDNRIDRTPPARPYRRRGR